MKTFIKLLLLVAMVVPITAMAQGQLRHGEVVNSQLETKCGTRMIAQENVATLNENIMPSFSEKTQSPAVIAPRKAAPTKVAPILTPEIQTVSITVCDGTDDNLYSPI